MDLISFFATLLTLFTNPLGVMDAAATGLDTAQKGIDMLQLQFRQWIGRTFARPMRTLVWWSCGFLFAIVVFATFLHFKILTDQERENGILVTFLVVSIISIGISAFVAWWQGNYVIGRNPADDAPDNEADQPLRVRIILTGAVLIATIMAVSFLLSLHALYTESSALWLVSMVTRYLGFTVIGVALTVIAWIVRRPGGFLEKVVQLVIELVAPIAPGITYANVRQKLFPNGLNLYEEEMVAAKIAGITSTLVLILLPFDLVIFALPFVEVALIFGALYLVKVAGGWWAIKVGREDLVTESRRKLAALLYVYLPWLAALSVGLFRILYLIAPALFVSIKAWWRRLLHFDVQLVTEHHPLVNLILILFGLGLILVAYGVTKSRSMAWKVPVVGMAALFTLNFFGSLLINMGVWDGATSRVEPKTIDQVVNVNNAGGMDGQPTHERAAENSWKLAWTTDHPSDGQVEIREIRKAVCDDPATKEVEAFDEDYVHRTYHVGKRFQAQSTLDRKAHVAMIDDLAPGITVAYRIHSAIVHQDEESKERHGDLTGLSSITREFNVGIPLDCGGTASASAPQPSANGSIPSPNGSSAGTPPTNPPDSRRLSRIKARQEQRAQLIRKSRQGG